MKAKFIQRPDSVDFVPAQDIAAGEIVKLGNLIGITKVSVRAGTLGSLTLTGVFDVTKPSDVAFTAGESVYCADTGVIGKTGTLLGTAVMASPAGSKLVRILLNCNSNQTVTPGGVDAEWQQL